MGESKTSKRRIAAVEKQVKALELRKAGVTFEEIAKTLGYAGPSGAFRAVDSALEKTLQEPADKLRQIEWLRLEQMQRALWPTALSGDLGAIDRLVRIMERRARLLGLDSRVEVGLVGPGGGPIIRADLAGMTNEELEKRLKLLTGGKNAK